MEKQYFLIEDGKPSKPYTYEELTKMNIEAKTLICEKFGDWKEAKDFPEFLNKIEWSPSLPKSKDEQKPSSNFNDKYFEKLTQPRKIKTILFSSILIVSFFIPWIKAFLSFSAWDILFGTVSEIVTTNLKYLLALIPIVGIYNIYSVTLPNETSKGLKKIVMTIPIIVLLIFIFIYGININHNSELGNNDVVRFLGIGFWISLICSIALVIVSNELYPKSTATLVYEQYLIFIYDTLLVGFVYIMIKYYKNNLLAVLTNTLGIVVVFVLLIIFMYFLYKLIKMNKILFFK